EIEHHLQLRTEELVGRGLEPAAARAEAERRFGDPDRVRREVEAIDREHLRRRGWLERVSDVRQDGTFAIRGLRRNPAFAAAAILTLGLGIGANAAVFSAVNQVLLRPLPVAEPERLVMLWEENPERGWVRQTAAASNFLDWRERIPAFSDLAAYASFSDRVTLSAGSDLPAVVESRLMTGNLFGVLGVDAAVGRVPAFEETWEDAAPIVVLSHGAWTRVFSGDPGVVGRTVRLDGASHEIVGVLPESFALPGVPSEVWVPARWSREAVADPSFRRAHWLRVIGRLAPGASTSEAGEQLRAVMSQLEAEYPETNRLMGAGLTPLQEFLVGDRRIALLVLLGAVGLLLVLACANVGNLLLVRGLGRRRELAVRAALGAGWRRLVRQAMVESLTLSALGAAAGLGTAWLLVRGLNALGQTADLAPEALRIDTTFLAYIGGITLACATAFSLVPTFFATRGEPGTALGDGGRGSSTGRSGRRAAEGLVTAEVALAFLLLSGAALLGRSYLQLRQVDPGFDPSGVLTAAVSLPGSRYGDDTALAGFYGRAIERVATLPGVSHAGIVRQLPMTVASWSSDFSVAGRTADEYGVEVLHREVAGDYFGALRIPLLAGRRFTAGDDAEAERVIVINEALARSHFRDSDPVGQRIAFTRAPTESSTWWTIVGVVGSERQSAPADEPRMEIFAPLAQDPTRSITIVARTSAEPGSLARPLGEAIREIDPEVGLYDVRTMAEVRSAAVAREEFLALLLAGFAAVALVLALVGIYGVIAQSLRHRRREIGIRMAIGAAKAHILGMVTRQTMTILAAGIGVGLVAAVLAARAVAAMLYGVSPLDPVSLLTTPAVLVLGGLAAAALPALRASRTDPSRILREE
ncbi:MAG TPA: ABC transporter permease, partial [Longimicrobiaceae bacterium]|nr:ABC transporter permease [Longimicrobiaceae bacterium]